MRATFKGALAALAAVALAGCTGTGVQAPTEAPTASVSAAPKTVQQVTAAVTSETRTFLANVAGRFDNNACQLVLERKAPGPERDLCAKDLAMIGRHAGTILADLEAQRPWPAAVEDRAQMTSKRLRAVVLAAADDTQVQVFSDAVLFLLRDLKAWSAPKG